MIPRVCYFQFIYLIAQRFFLLAPQFPQLNVSITCAATIPCPYGLNTIAKNPALPPLANLQHGHFKIYPPLKQEAKQRYCIPHPSDFKKPSEDVEEYYVVSGGKAVSIFTDLFAWGGFISLVIGSFSCC